MSGLVLMPFSGREPQARRFITRIAPCDITDFTAIICATGTEISLLA